MTLAVSRSHPPSFLRKRLKFARKGDIILSMKRKVYGFTIVLKEVVVKKAVAMFLLLLTFSLYGCPALTTDEFYDLPLGEVLPARIEDLCEKVADGYIAAVKRTVTRVHRDGTVVVEVDEFARLHKMDPAVPDAFYHTTFASDGFTLLALDCWRSIEGIPVRYELIGPTVYAETTEETAAAMQQSHTWNFLPLFPWNDYGDVDLDHATPTKFATEFPMDAILSENVFSGYAAAYADELSHLKADGTSGIDVYFDFQDYAKIITRRIRVQITFRFDLDDSYDGVTERMVCRFDNYFTVDYIASTLELIPETSGKPLIASHPDYLYKENSQSLLIILDTTLLSDCYLRFYFTPGIYYATAPVGSPGFTCEWFDEDNQPIAFSDGHFTIVEKGMYLMRIVALGDPILTFRVGSRPSSEYR